MDVVGWYVLYQKYNHKDGIQNQNFGNIPVVVCHCIDNISCDDWKNPGWGMLDNEKENGTSQRAIAVSYTHLFTFGETTMPSCFIFANQSAGSLNLL